jgi:hypothetical protein
MMPIVLGGLFIGVLSALPIVGLCNCCCLWIIGGGVLSAYLGQQNEPVALTIAEGARLGLFAGIVGTVIWFALDTVLAPLQARFIGEFVRTARDLPPELQNLLEEIEAGRGRGNVAWFVLMLIGVSIISTIGGMIGAAYFRKDVPPALGGPMSPPPLP